MPIDRDGIADGRRCDGDDGDDDPLADALHDSGGRGTLVTTCRPNYGSGALRDREAHPSIDEDDHVRGGPTGDGGGSSPYRRAWDEHRLFTPLQRIAAKKKPARKAKDGSSSWVRQDAY